MGQMYFPGELVNDCSAEIEKIWVEHNASEYGEKGMRIHMALDINGFQSKQLEVSIYFYYATDNNPIIDTNNRYCTSDGHVATHINITPPYDNYHYSDLSLFMPYNELHVYFKCSCYFFIQIWSGDEVIATSERKDFYMGLG